MWLAGLISSSAHNALGQRRAGANECSLVRLDGSTHEPDVETTRALLVLEREIGLAGPYGLRRKLEGFTRVKGFALLLGPPDCGGRRHDLVDPPVPRAHSVYCRLIEPDDGAERAGDRWARPE
jgi:hypothetical protein